MNVHSVFLGLLLFFAACSQPAKPFDIAKSGGTTFLLEVDAADFVAQEANYTQDPVFREALHELQKPGASKQRIGAFVDRLEQLSQGQSAAFFLYSRSSGYAQARTADDLKRILLQHYEDRVIVTCQIIGARLDRMKIGVDQAVVTHKAGQIVLDVAGTVNAALVQDLVRTNARTGFYETIDAPEVLAGLLNLETRMNDTLDRTSEHPLIGLFAGPPTDNAIADCRVGSVAIHDTAAFNRILREAGGAAAIRSDLYLAWGFSPDEDNGGRTVSLYALKAENPMKPLLDATSIMDAHAGKSEYNGNMEISITMTQEGAGKWRKITAANIGKTLAITYDGKVITAPRVNAPIENGTTVISGDFTMKEATDIAAMMRSSLYPVRVVLLESRTVSPH